MISLLKVFFQINVFDTEFQVGLLMENSSVLFLFVTTALIGGVVFSVEPAVRVKLLTNVFISICLPALITAGLHRAGFSLNVSLVEFPDKTTAIKEEASFRLWYLTKVESAVPLIVEPLISTLFVP